MRILLKILEPLYPMIRKYRDAAKLNPNKSVDSKDIDHITDNDGASESEQNEGTNAKNDKEVTENTEETVEFQQLEVLYEILSSFLLEYCSIAFLVSHLLVLFSISVNILIPKFLCTISLCFVFCSSEYILLTTFDDVHCRTDRP